MRKKIKILKIITISVISIITISILSFDKVYATSDIEKMIEKEEYSEEYKKWLDLSDEEKQKIMKPRMYDIVNQKSNTNYLKSINNVLKTSRLLRATLSNKYTLQDEIKDNVAIRNQMKTNSCWAFAAIGALETNLALTDKLASRPVTIYDYSEKHMNYGTVRNNFLDDEINDKGFERQLKSGGTFEFARAYLTNGSGAVQEEEVPFEDTEEKIDISEIRDATVETTLYDTVEFEKPTDSTKQDLIAKIKEHITNYGGIYAGIYGSQLLSDNYNNKTGAIYCKSSEATPSNHAVTIIGWDDDFDKSNFNQKNQPQENGAWIVKNSWGDNITQNLEELKEQLFEANSDEYEENEWYEASDIPNDTVIKEIEEVGYGEGKVKIEGENIVIEIGDKGYMYVSYEDANIYNILNGIQKATSTTDYFNLYQHDILGPSTSIKMNSNSNIFIANVFERNADDTEQIDKISLYTYEGCTCKVYVNPNGSEKDLESLKQVQLKSGETQNIDPGYHTIEFAKPVQLKSDKFVVVVEISNNPSKSIAIEHADEKYFKNAEVNEGESYITDADSLSKGEWQDLATMQNGELKGNVTIKAFTQEKEEEPTKEPVSSNFDDSIAELTDAKCYFFTNSSDDSYSKIKIKVSNIKIGDEEDSYTYYYYLSGTQGDTEIPQESWKQVKAEKQADGTYEIIIDINSKDITNYDEISQSDNLFIYIKEVAQIDDNKIETIKELPIENNIEPTFYLDGEQMGSLEEILDIIDGNNDSNNQDEEENKTQKDNVIKQTDDDNTKAKLALPQTGAISIAVLICIIILLVGGYSYYRYKNIDK